MNFIRNCRRFLSEYVSSNTVLSERFLSLHSIMNGLTGPATAEAISHCVKLMDKNLCYLEVGIYQGCNLSLVAHHNPEIECVGVDNFSQAFKENELTQLTTEECVQNKVDFFRLKNTTIIKDDFRSFLSKPGDKKVGVYFFDGPHEFQDQVDGIELALSHLADEAIVFIDDLRSENVQKSYSFLVEKHPELTPICFFTNQQYGQGQVVLEYKRDI